MTGAYNTSLVALSVLISVLASFTALDLGSRVQAATGSSRIAWLSAAAAAMGAGIWSMHFVAMLAFSLPIPVSYDLGLTAVSLFAAIGATAVGFFLVANMRSKAWVTLAAGVPMGLGVVAMHYTGMAAMRMAAHLRYEPLLVAASVAIALVASAAALFLAFHTHRLSHKALAAIVMGAAVCGMHYTGMAAAHFDADATAQVIPSPLAPQLLAIAVAAVTFFVLFLALVAAVFDRHLADRAQESAVALAVSERRFRAYFENVPDCLFVVARGTFDGIFRFEMLNPGAERLVGVPSATARGRTAPQLFGGEGGPVFDELFAKCAERGEPVRIEHHVVFKTGPREIETVLVPLDEGDGIVRLIGSARDQTARKEAESRLRQSQKIEAVGQLTGGVAHDFNNLLTAIIGNLELAVRRAESPPLKRAIESALQAAERGARLVDQLLAFSRRQQLEPETVNLNTLITGMTDLLQRTLGAGIAIRTDLESDPWAATVDRNQLELAILNLAINARDAMPDGGELTLITRNVPATDPKRPSDLPAGDLVTIAVRDTGAGMDEETAARAFEPFYTTKAPGKGTGLGLSQVYGFVQQSNGAARIDSRPGGGTTVHLFIPRAPGATTSVAARASVAD